MRRDPIRGQPRLARLHRFHFGPGVELPDRSGELHREHALADGDASHLRRAPGVVVVGEGDFAGMGPAHARGPDAEGSGYQHKRADGQPLDGIGFHFKPPVLG